MTGDENNEVSVSIRQAPVREFLRELMCFGLFMHSQNSLCSLQMVATVLAAIFSLKGLTQGPGHSGKFNQWAAVYLFKIYFLKFYWV